MLDVFKEHLRWNYIMGLSNVGDFNLACETGHATDLINVAEALQEKKIAQIADDIYHRGENGNRVKLVLISGPSSSGKTTFSKRLSVQLMTNGLRPYPISLDNYFVDREDTPRDENGNYDYESLYALDLELFNTQLQASAPWRRSGAAPLQLQPREERVQGRQTSHRRAYHPYPGRNPCPEP